MDLARFAASLGGTVERSTFAAFGVPGTALTAAVRSGELHRVRRGCYTVRGADPVRRAEVAWQGTATCVTELDRLGLPVPPAGGLIHLTRGFHRSESGRNLSTPAHVRWHLSPMGRLQWVSPALALDESARCIGRVDQLIALDAALAKRTVTLDDVAAFDVTSRRRRDWLLALADERTQSPPETLARVALHAAKIPFEFQYSWPGTGRVDFLIGGLFVVEVDGWSYHSDDSSFGRDRARDRSTLLSGSATMRYTAWDVINRPALMVDEVWRFLRMRRAIPRPA
ncbi:hypothetical protein Lsed01_02387 [Demequina sediminis]|uniref:AbiEi antitoxin N-terminal domain-containing protein n=1 Tax=Demequina sediminis TaxID=1930058 RepID=A0ABP9WK10_9MICO|nr:type IV toxin-antitoxin system AbiEi family antitoxin domain-containing protein [Demequina sediminis]BDZ62160.1 hypothetical protein GCM10025873_19510 [Demequina sediminis]